jgi:hypothetical protein
MGRSRRATDDAAGEIVSPPAAAMLGSMRALGYDLPAAIADIVDNSIAAEARHVWIDFHWDGSDSRISITDDGRGMSTTELVAAMRPGTRHPEDQRDAKDLGRFGLGLKTAAISQGRRLVVWSRRATTASIRCWDLDHVGVADDWQLLKPRQISDIGRSLPRRGTVVILEKLDRLVGETDVDSEKDHNRFLEKLDAVRSHLGLVFHRFIDRGDVTLRVNSATVEAWDPFMTSITATQAQPVSKLSFEGGTVVVSPFVLPHHSKLTKKQHQAGGGPRGWNAHQGFFVYRNERLLVAGEWLGLGWRKEEHYKLARIQVDFDSAFDTEWDINVMKSRAIPPKAIRDKLRQIGEITRTNAKRIYSHRGTRLVRGVEAESAVLWEQIARRGKVIHRLNRQHPVIRAAASVQGMKSLLEPLLRMIEESLPVSSIAYQATSDEESVAEPFQTATESEIRSLLHETFQLLTASGVSPEIAAQQLAAIQPFRDHPALLQRLKEESCHG